MIQTKNLNQISGSNSSKTLMPGNQKIKINSLELQDFPFKDNALHLMLHCEGPDMGENFDGFFLDKNNEELGRYKGQVGRIKASYYAFSDNEYQGKITPRDVRIAYFLSNLCQIAGCTDWYNSQDQKHETIESLIMAFNEEKPLKDIYLNACVAGKEYMSKGGYINHDLYLPNFKKGALPLESINVESPMSQLTKFDPSLHIIKLKVEQKSEGFESDDQSFLTNDVETDSMDFLAD